MLGTTVPKDARYDNQIVKPTSQALQLLHLEKTMFISSGAWSLVDIRGTTLGCYTLPPVRAGLDMSQLLDGFRKDLVGTSETLLSTYTSVSNSLDNCLSAYGSLLTGRTMYLIVRVHRKLLIIQIPLLVFVT